MSDDALKILADAGVKCPEAEELWGWPADHFLGSVGFVEQRKAEAVILALARLVAECKGRCDSAYDGGFDTGREKGWREAEDKYEPQLWRLRDAASSLAARMSAVWSGEAQEDALWVEAVIAELDGSCPAVAAAPEAPSRTPSTPASDSLRGQQPETQNRA